jgi:LmbE family N-acetylglucosaminyl deacetylase
MPQSGDVTVAHNNQTHRVLLAVFAHPDDESFGPGGTLARYAAEGADVWLVCATDGDAGTVDAEMLASYRNTAQLRAAELCCAAQALGLSGVDWLGYRDSGMPGSTDNQHPQSLYQAPLEEVVARIVAAIREHQPQVIICDNQYGGYGHPDHIKLHQATVQAFTAAGDAQRYPEAGPPCQPQWLYFTAFSPGWLKLLVRLMPLAGRNPRQFGRNKDIDLIQIVSWETPVHARLDVRPYLDIKQRASACHKSQGGGTQQMRGLPGWIARRYMGYETFTQGFPAPRPGEVQQDLFGDGVSSPA